MSTAAKKTHAGGTAKKFTRNPTLSKLMTEFQAKTQADFSNLKAQEAADQVEIDRLLDLIKEEQFDAAELFYLSEYHRFESDRLFKLAEDKQAEEKGFDEFQRVARLDKYITSLA